MLLSLMIVLPLADGCILVGVNAIVCASSMDAHAGMPKATITTAMLKIVAILFGFMVFLLYQSK
jgi:hypothetical protein